MKKYFRKYWSRVKSLFVKKEVIEDEIPVDEIPVEEAFRMWKEQQRKIENRKNK